MKKKLKQVGATLGRLHRDEGGAEMLETLLIIAAIVLPLLGLLIWFRNDIGNWVRSIWSEQKSEAEDFDSSP